MPEPVNVRDLTFGVEIECCLPYGTCQVGGYHCGRQIDGLPAGWNAQRDCSIRAGDGSEGVEVVSPVLKGEDGVRQVLAVCRWLAERQAKVNRSCGFHVHVGWSGDEAALKRLVHLVSNFEKAIYASTGTQSREQGTYCRTVRSDCHFQRLYRDGEGRGGCHDRYHVLNLANLDREPGRRTVEFRAFAGTTNVTKIMGHVRLCLGLVERALFTKREPKWVAKTPVESSPIHRAGEGQTELTRFFYAMGWTKGRESHTYGNVTADGAPDVAAVKKELMRLAKKYDGGQEDEVPPTPEPGRHVDDGSWERSLCRGQQVRVRLPDGSDVLGTFVRRYPRTLVVRVPHLQEPIRVPRLNNPARSENNGAFPTDTF